MAVKYTEPPVLSGSHWRVEQNSSLVINATSNVGCFSCSTTDYTAHDTLVIRTLAGQTAVQSAGKLTVPLKDIKCHTVFASGGLRKTLRADVYPNLEVRFLKLEGVPEGKTKAEMTASLEVKLAGVTRYFSMPFSATKTPDGRMVMTGKRRCRFGDFNLEPPRKFAGLFRVEDDFLVVINMNLSRL
jgi:hypothetical protein